MAGSFLRHIRADTKEELVKRICQGIAEINRDPAVYRRRCKMDEIAAA